MSMKSESRIFNTLRRGAPALLLTLAYARVAQAYLSAPSMTLPCSTLPPDRVYSIEVNKSPPAGSEPFITASDNATWTFPGAGSDSCGVVGTTARSCAGLSVTLTNGVNQTPNFGGPASMTVTEQKVTIKAALGVDSCTADFTFRATSAVSGGWGDPHLTTVDGVKYDFQSAGEFTALRENAFVLQTRQTPVPTATVPITNAYTGITHCVAIYTAVATKLGSSRVTVQPSPGAEPDPKSMQVRVNGNVVTLGDAPYILYAEGEKKGVIDGTITKHPDGMYEITDARGTQVVVTSNFWDTHKVWYLNVSVYGTTAHDGTMGKLAERSWLPALPDGSSLGAKPASEADRYKALYEKFADAWRVTDATSLFDYKDYEPGTTTATYTRKEWPRNHPESCAIEGQTSAQAATEQVAQEACADVVDATRKADCVFDVMVTGNTGFGKSYKVAQRFAPLPPGWYSPVPPKEPKCEKCPTCKDCPNAPEHPWRCCWLLVALGIVQLLLLVFLVRRALKKP
jgi:hypothetical protein